MNQLIKKPLLASIAIELSVPSREQNGLIEWISINNRMTYFLFLLLPNESNRINKKDLQNKGTKG